MSNELEQKLSAALDRLPAPTSEATKRARSAALATLPPAPRRPAGWLAVIALAAVLGAVGLGAAALAATGKLHVVLGARVVHAPPAPGRLAVPAGTDGIALVAGGKLWLTTRRGLRIEGMAVSTAELSPHALYAVVGLGTSLVALAPGQRRAWTHQTTGRVVAAAWSPDGLKIAYVVRGRFGTELRIIEGDGDHDRLLVRGVAAAKPVWRSDSLALTYFLPGRKVVLDFKRGTRRSYPWRGPLAGLRTVRAVSPGGRRIAVAIRGPNRIVELRVLPRGGRGASTLLFRVRALPSPVAISWR